MKKNTRSFETAARYLAMLSHIPRRPYKVTTTELAEKLATEGFAIEVRSIQRDLNKLSAHFALQGDNSRPAGWCWTEAGPRRSFPHMDLSTALTHELLALHLAPVLPRKLLAQLEPSFQEARQVLSHMAASPLGKWSRRIAVVPPWQQLLPAQIAEGVVDVVYEALLAGRRFEADYLKPDADTPKRRLFNPQGLVYQQGVLYLVASLFDYDDPRLFALHRMKNAELLEDPAKTLAGFDLSRYIANERALDIPLGRTIQLELRITKWLAGYLGERRLSHDQTISPIRGDARFRLHATVPETEQLHWWLRSFGPALEVMKPAALRRRMANEADVLAAMYR